jgi:hypothetical protein
MKMKLLHCIAIHTQLLQMMILFYLLQLIGQVDSFSQIHAPTHRSSPTRSTPFFATSGQNPPYVSMSPYPPTPPSSTTSLSLHGGMDPDISQALMSPSSSIMLSQEDSWRQYVPVVVIGLVLIDVLLGSPFAKSLLNKARPEALGDESDANNRPSALGSNRESTPNPARGGTTTTTTTTTTSYSRKPRIDVDGYAKAALERAEGVAQLREYLEAQKTDWDRMEDMKRQMDQKMQELDRKNRKEEEAS